MRLINADALMEDLRIHEDCDVCPRYEDGCKGHLQWLCKRIKNAPTVEIGKCGESDITMMRGTGDRRMSVYITGDLKIPEANFRLVQLWNDGTACWKQDGKFMQGQWQYVSDHGDLIDKNKVVDLLHHGSKCVSAVQKGAEDEKDISYCQGVMVGYANSIVVLDNAPVIIPAERSE